MSQNHPKATRAIALPECDYRKSHVASCLHASIYFPDAKTVFCRNCHGNFYERCFLLPQINRQLSTLLSVQMHFSYTWLL